MLSSSILLLLTGLAAVVFPADACGVQFEAVYNTTNIEWIEWAEVNHNFEPDCFVSDIKGVDDPSACDPSTFGCNSIIPCNTLFNVNFDITAPFHYRFGYSYNITEIVEGKEKEKTINGDFDVTARCCKDQQDSRCEHTEPGIVYNRDRVCSLYSLSGMTEDCLSGS